MNTSTFIPPGVYGVCIALLAVEDEIVEGDEAFTIAVVVDQSDEVNGNTTVIILDNDGKRS